MPLSRTGTIQDLSPSKDEKQAPPFKTPSGQSIIHGTPSIHRGNQADQLVTRPDTVHQDYRANLGLSRTEGTNLFDSGLLGGKRSSKKRRKIYMI